MIPLSVTLSFDATRTLHFTGFTDGSQMRSGRIFTKVPQRLQLAV
jgi:hypothetical protein